MTDLSALSPGTGKSHQALSALTAEQLVDTHWSEADIPSLIGKTIYQVILKTSATLQRNHFQALLGITLPAKPWVQRALVDHLLWALPALKTKTFPNPMWLQQAKLHAISGNMPWATLSLIYSCLSKLLRLQSYRSFPFKSDIIVTEYFLWALKVCSWSRKCVTATESTIYCLDFKHK